PAAVCISESRQTVKARVRAVEHIAPMSRKRLAIAVTAVLLLATVGTVPWKLTRAVADAEETPPAWVSPDVTSDPVEIMFSILDPNGQPLADRDLKVGVYGHDELLLETDTYTIHRGLSVAPAEKTDAAGRVTIREFAGKITPICMVHKLGYGIGPRFDLEPGDRIQVTIKLQPFASVHGTLVDAETGEVIHGANIGWNAAEESFLGTPDAPVVTNTRGAFLVADLVPGNYEIYARADGYARVGTHLFAPPGAQQEITFRAEREDPARLPATGDVDTAGPESRPPVAGSGDIASGLTAIVGTVVDSGGRPVANGLVHAFVAPLAPGAEREDGFSDAPMYVREGATSHSTGLYQTRVTPWQPAPVRTGELGEFSVPRPDAEG
ncbi:MAG TPA: carboxypeptidase-like regulatory domain-containing protein, partial [Armatimonadota bacterium]|nr:carboxypeptidase-like regulatory domain-containing protein [Armatimonadota bacterium]